MNSLLSFVMTGIAPLDVMNSDESFIATYRFATNSFVTIIIALGTVVTLTANDFAYIL